MKHKNIIEKSINRLSKSFQPSSEFVSFENKRLHNLFKSKYEIVNQVVKSKIFKEIEFISFGEGEPLLFLHTICEVPLAYRKLINKFSKDYKVIAPALPGHSKTGLPDKFKSISMEDLLQKYLDFIDEVLEVNNVKDKVTIVGHAFGGTLGIKYAIKNPNKVERLILADANTRPLDLHSIRNLFKGFMSQLDFLINNKKISTPGGVNLLRNFRNHFFSINLLEQINIIEDLGKLTVKTIVNWGEKDSLTPIEWANDIVKAVKNAELNIVEGRRHNWLLDSPEELKI